MPDYEKLTVIKLRDELVTRGLPKAGLKATLVQRLIEADAQSEKTESTPNTFLKRDESLTKASPCVTHALGEPVGNYHAAADIPQPRVQDEEKSGVAEIDNTSPPVRSQIQSEGLHEDKRLEERASDRLTEPSGSALPPNDSQGENIFEDIKRNTEESELQLLTPNQTEIEDVPVGENKAGVLTKTPLTGNEFLEESRKRKRRSQSPPPSSIEITQKKFKASNGRPLVELPEDYRIENQQKRSSDKLSRPDSTHSQESHAQNHGDACSNGKNDFDSINASATVGQCDDKDISHSQIHSPAHQGSDTTNERDAMPVHVKSLDSPRKSSPSDTRFRNLFTASANPEAACQQSHHSDIEDKPVRPALHAATSALYIRELMRPLKMESLRDHLIALATPPDTAVHPDIVTDFFLDSIRTHCLVGFENISAASRVRSGLHDRVWPNERDRRQLWVDFVPEENLKNWIDVERTAGNGRGRPSKRWEVVYKDGDNGIQAYLQEVGFNGGGLRAVNPSRLDTSQGVQVAGPRVSGAEPRNIQLMSDVGKGFQALDDLFASTTAKPKLYYLPVPKAEADQRLAKLAAGRGRGRGDDMRRFSFEDSSIVDNGPDFGKSGCGRGGSYSSSYRGNGRGYPYRLDAPRGDRWRERRSGF